MVLRVPISSVLLAVRTEKGGKLDYRSEHILCLTLALKKQGRKEVGDEKYPAATSFPASFSSFVFRNPILN